MSRPTVFLGPSLPLKEARKILDADYRPPVKRGDLGQLKDVEVVAIIDGVFLQNCSVGHREILSLLERGVKVVGGGSMGALRAAELQRYGMVGIGRIFEMYSQGEVEGDDEVALVFDPESMEPLSEPMVNIRCTLSEAVSAKVLTPEVMEELLRRLRSVYYPRRTIPAFMAMVDSILEAERVELFELYFAKNYRDIKKEDAINVLKFLKNLS
ncbi:MAG: TfuA-related McrA-glycine thioamidation protein [Methanomassiliicoccales archaeon]|nr:TfuA-related McrA-glycine thioamidation protein [Methanomassiliicoccales archaeon]